MKRVKQLITLSLILFTICLGCKKEDDSVNEQPTEQGENPQMPNEPDNPNNQDETDFQEVSITVTLPDNATINLSETSLQSMGEFFDVSSTGETTALHFNGVTSLAFLIDQDENILLAGFITDSKREISVRSTIEASLYFALGTVFLPQEIKDTYLAEVSEGFNIDELVNASENLFLGNPNFSTSEAYKTLIGTTVDELVKDPDPIDISTSKIESLTRSNRNGIELLEEAGNNVLFENSTRRRTHAFFYKTESLDEAGNNTILINDIANENGVALNDVIVEPASGLTSVLGGLVNIFSGKGQELLSKKSKATTLQLEDNEFRSIYKARLIGPGLAGTNNRFTDAENDMLFQLNIETFGLDIVVPIVSALISTKADKFSKLEREDLSEVLNTLNVLVSTIDPINTALKEGDFNKAKDEFLINSLNSANVAEFGNLIKAITDAALKKLDGNDVNAPARIIKTSENLLAGLKFADAALAALDVFRIIKAIATADSLEEWEISVKRSNVSIDPEQASVTFGDEGITLTATVDDMELATGQSFEYVWTSTGQFGFLNDDATDRSDRNTLTTSRNSIVYSAEDNEEGEEEISVEVFLREGQSRIRVNDAASKIQIIPSDFVIRPANATIKGGASLVLFVEDEDGNNITQNSRYEYAVVWETPGAYGLFNGTQRIVSDLGKNSVVYQSLELEDKGEETISATIYRRESATESFRFVNTIGTTVFIENDPNVKIFYVNITHELDTPNSIRVRNGSGVHYEAAFLQPEIERGISYEFTVLDFSHPGLPDGGRSRIDGRPISVTRATHPVRIDVEKNIRGVIMGRSDISDLPDFAELRAQQRAMISAITGRAQVVVRLSPEN